MRSTLIVFLASLLLVASCAQARGDGSIAVGRTIRDLADFSDLIVVGTVLKLGDTRNLARQVSDPRQEAKEVVVLGQDYTVRVETTVKGNVTPASLIAVSLARWHGTHAQAPGVDPDYIPFVVGDRYVLFLKPIGDGTGAFAQGLEPFRFRIQGTSAHAESRWPDASKVFPDKTPDALIADIRTATRP